jgi:PQQ-dependent catabolism-associated CXXCW motif protein
MDEPGYDELAKVLQEMAGRFGETAFSDRRRLVSLLSDRLPEARRDIKVVGAAVDEHVFETLTRARPEQLDLEIERMAAKLENGLGIRRDVATPVVQACAYGLSLGPLPSQAGAMLNGGSGIGPAAVDDSWVGVSAVVQQPAAAGQGNQSRNQFGNQSGYQPTPQGAYQPYVQPTTPPPSNPPPVQPRSRTKLIGGIAIAGVVGLLLFRSIHVVPDPEPAPAPQPQPAPINHNPSPQPAPNPIPTPPTPIPPAPIPPTPAPRSQEFYAEENADFHIPPQTILQSNVGTPTPTTIPGGRTVTTMQVAAEMQTGNRMLLIDALQSPHAQTIKGAISLPYSGASGSFNDQIEARLMSDLARVTQGHKDIPLVFFCVGARCWESYNAALRAHVAGYPNIFWFRGGLAAWEEAGLPMQPMR